MVLGLMVCFGVLQYYHGGAQWPIEYIEIRWRHSGAYEDSIPWARNSHGRPQTHVHIVEEHHEGNLGIS